MDEHCVRHKKRSEEELKSLTARLNRVSGQVSGIRRMLEEERYCVDILMQVSAGQAALSAFSKELMQNHVRTCVAEDIREGREGAVEELCELLKQTMK